MTSPWTKNDRERNSPSGVRLCLLPTHCADAQREGWERGSTFPGGRAGVSSPRPLSEYRPHAAPRVALFKELYMHTLHTSQPFILLTGPCRDPAVPQILRNSVSVQHGAFLMDSKGGYALCLQDSWWPHGAVSNTLLRKLMAVSTLTA